MGRKKGIIGKQFTDAVIDELAVKLITWIKIPNNFWLGNFAAENEFHRGQLSVFAEKNKNFASAYNLAYQIQENKLVMGGLSKKLDVTMVIFSLKNVAGWRDKHEHMHKGNVTFANLIKLSTEK